MKQEKTEILVALDPHGFGQIQSRPASRLGSRGGCRVQLFVAPWPAAPQTPLSTLSQSLLELTSIKLVMPSHHLIFCHPLLLLPSIFPSIRVFSNELALPITWPKYWNFIVSICPFNEYLGLISFRIDWFDLFALQGTLNSLLQHHSLKASIFWCLAFFMVQLSLLFMTYIHISYIGEDS